MISIRKTMLAVVGIPMAFALQGCEPSDVALGAGVVAIGAGALAIDAANDDYYDDHYYGNNYDPYYGNNGYYGNDGYYGNNNYYGNNYGNNYGHGYNGYYYGSGNGYHSGQWWKKTRSADVARKNTEKAAFASDWAKRFDLAVPEATKLITALDQSRSGNLKALEQIGFSEADVKAMGRFNLPADTAIQNIASNLRQNPNSTKAMLQTLMQTAKKDLQNVNGRIWNDCRATGAWKTPQYNRCTDSKTSGCSPATGATMCVPII